jgi:D-threo-aldose 1-dehydrogenase
MDFTTRRVGRTALAVTPLGLGCATLAGNVASVTNATARETIDAAYDSGLRYFDTSPYYGYGRSEHLVGDQLRERSGWVLSSKVGRLLKPLKNPRAPTDQWRDPFPFEAVFDYSYDGVMRSYEDSLQRLGLDHVDILYMHDLGLFTHGTPERLAPLFRTAMESGYKALDELRRNGDIKAIGLGVDDAEPIGDALDHGTWDVFLLAGRYTLLEQAPLHDIFPKVAGHGASIVVGGPFNSGVLVGGDTFNYGRAPADVIERVAALRRVADAHGVPLAAAALQFVAAHPVVASVIPGPRTPDELGQILAWWKTPVPAAFWADLKDEGLLDSQAPVPN